MILSIDIETYCELDLGEVGVYRYVEHPSFEVLMIAYAIDDEPVQIMDLAYDHGEGDYTDADWIRLYDMLRDESITKSAFNANFERVCLSKHYAVEMPPEQWQCTMVKALTLGLPSSLAKCASVLGVTDKDKAGKSLINYFSKPCKPTKVNGGRTRNTADDNPEKWAQFLGYCKTDVVVEREISRKLSIFETTDAERRAWVLDQRINDRGVMLDADLVEAAIRMDAKAKKELKSDLIALTGVENPNSLQQLKDWIQPHVSGVDVHDIGLTKHTMPEIRAAGDDEAKQMIDLREKLKNSSTSKFKKMSDVMCEDRRARGQIQFYGASRTGRFSGRHTQVHNLRRNDYDFNELLQARRLVKEGDMESIRLLYGDVGDTLSQLLRTAFIPAPGHLFYVSDFSAIEARVIAWLAGETWRLDVFNSHGKIYEASASMMFDVPMETITKDGENYHLRAQGKVAELACIAEGELVLTDKGLVPIEKVTSDHLVYDGESFVSHSGVCYNGVREVIKYDGLRATEDHIVFKGKREPLEIHMGDAAKSGENLFRPEFNREAIRMGKNCIRGKKKGERKLLCENRVRKLWVSTMDGFPLAKERQIKRLPKMFTTEKNTEKTRQKTHIGETKMRKHKRRRIPQLRSKGHRIPIQKCTRSGAMDHKKSRFTRTWYGTRQDRQFRPLRTRESQVRNKVREQLEQKNDCSPKMESGRLAVQLQCCYTKTKPGKNKRRYIQRRRKGRKREEKKLARHKEKTRVYDIMNAGPNNRYTVSGVLVHNCGYQGSVGAMRQMDFSGALTENDYKRIVRLWRAKSPRIVSMWYALEEAAVKAVRTGKPQATHGITFYTRGGFLFCRLPSGRDLAYPKPRLFEGKFGNDQIAFKTYSQGRWREDDTYGGKLAENITQAVARDLLVHAMENLEAAGYKIVLHVHDEVVIEAPDTDPDATMSEIDRIMGTGPSWSEGLPLGADGYTCEFYLKD